MSELSFEQMLEDSVKTIRNGEIVQGTVIDVKEDEIILNIGYKADGIITKNEYSNDASLVLTDAVHVGDTMEAKVLKGNDGEGQVTLTYKILHHFRTSTPIKFMPGYLGGCCLPVYLFGEVVLQCRHLLEY